MNNPSEFNDIMHLFLSHGDKKSSIRPAIAENTVVIYPPTIDWNYMRQRPQQLMEQFSLHGFEVYYCNKTQHGNELLTVINPKLTLVHQNKYFIKEIVPNLKKQGKRILLWVSWSKLHAFIDQYQPDFIIYDYLDDFAAWKPYLKPMIQKADLVVTTSGILQKQMETEFPNKKSFLVPNGCDMAHFKPSGHITVPPEFKAHYGPVITYSGAWARWVDSDLVNKIALTFKDALVAIIGMEFGAAVNRNIPNLKYLGYKPYHELPQYLQSSTVCIIPFILDEITVATNPIKMYEYLAAGKPVVSTEIPEAKNIPSVYIGADHDSFIEKIRMILEQKTAFNAKEVYDWLEQHTWKRRFEAILEILNKYYRC